MTSSMLYLLRLFFSLIYGRLSFKKLTQFLRSVTVLFIFMIYLYQSLAHFSHSLSFHPEFRNLKLKNYCYAILQSSLYFFDCQYFCPFICLSDCHNFLSVSLLNGQFVLFGLFLHCYLVIIGPVLSVLWKKLQLNTRKRPGASEIFNENVKKINMAMRNI